MIRQILLLLIAFFTANLALSSEISSDIFKYWSKGRFNQAIDLCHTSNQNLLATTICASRLLDPFYPGHYCSAAMDFLRKNPLWVQRTAMIQKGESLMHRWTASDVISWCKKYPPVSSKGQKLYLEAFVKQFGLTDQTISLIRKCWVCCSFSSSEMQEYLNLYGHFLRLCDHQDRLTDRIMASDMEAINPLLPLLDLNQRSKAKICILLLQQDKQAEQIFASYSKGQMEREVIYAFFKSYREDRIIPKRALMLMSDALFALNLENCYLSQWTSVRNILARELIVYKEYLRAYKLVENSVSGSRFLSGWIALSFLHQPKIALLHFLKMNQLAESSHNYAKSHYWIAKSLMQLNKIKEARVAFNRAGFFYSTFYGQLSLLALNKKHFCYCDSALDKRPLKGNQEMLTVVCLLKQYGRYDIARPMCKALFARLTRPEILFALNMLEISASTPEALYWNCVIGELAVERGVFVNKYLYPRLDCALEVSLSDSCLLHAVVRQESVFHTKAVSKAKAFGLMQILHNTGLKIAAKYGMDVEKIDLFDPKTNITLGNIHLKELLRRYRGSNVLTLAAYNAGPSNVFQWRKNNGKLSPQSTISETIEWIEKIPFPATSRYIQSVIANKVVYWSLFSGDSRILLYKALGHDASANIHP